MREDAQKRSALVASGRFWVWSVTSDDVKAALDGGLSTDDVDAEAEAAWCAAQVVVLTAAQAEYESIWQAQGWTTVLARGAWEVAVQDTLKAAGAYP